LNNFSLSDVSDLFCPISYKWRVVEVKTNETTQKTITGIQFLYQEKESKNYNTHNRV
jgi:hypothetical protein